MRSSTREAGSKDAALTHPGIRVAKPGRQRLDGRAGKRARLAFAAYGGQNAGDLDVGQGPPPVSRRQASRAG